MKFTMIALSLVAGFGAGCAAIQTAPLISAADLPNCIASNYDAARDLFTIRSDVGNSANQQCILRLKGGSYAATLASGGGGGAGGTVQTFDGGGGGGGGGAGAAQTLTTIHLTEGEYKLTIGAGGQGGNACIVGPFVFGGGPGWLGSPSNIVRVATSELVAGSPGADRYARPTRAQNERQAGDQRDGHGGSGLGQSSGGRGGHTEFAKTKVEATPGERNAAPEPSRPGGAAGAVPRDDQQSGAGGGGGATSAGDGGDGGGEGLRRRAIAPELGLLGSGGGGGAGNSAGCEPGSRGGHGFIALRPI